MSDEQGKSSRRGRGRPSAPVLTRDRITTTALDLVARKGHQAFTLQALARALRVSTSALYNHAASKATVMLWMQDSLNSTIDIDCFSRTTCRTALATWARSYRQAYEPYPMLVPVMAVQPVADAPATLTMYETVVGALVDDGWQPADAVDVVVALEAFVFGAALDTAAPENIFATHTDDHPRFSAAVAARDARSGGGRPSADAAFDLGLEALITGLYAS